jgi:hypothetical protein
MESGHSATHGSAQSRLAIDVRTFMTTRIPQEAYRRLFNCRAAAGLRLVPRLRSSPFCSSVGVMRGELLTFPPQSYQATLLTRAWLK